MKSPNPHPLDDLTDAEEYNFGHLKGFSVKPAFIPNANPRDIQIELQQLIHRPTAALPHEL